MAKVGKVLSSVASGKPSLLYDITKQVSCAPSKRLRPSLFIAILAGNGRKVTDKEYKAAAAIELIHLASLVHDDLIDKAATRWGRPTTYAEHGTAQAVVAGDYLFASANKLGAEAGPDIARVIAGTIQALCYGQSSELANMVNKQYSRNLVLQAIEGKTASLFAASCQLAAICAALSPKQVKAYRSYGLAFGVSYQLIDDLLDLAADADRFGKPILSDIGQGLYTLPVIYALDGPRRLEIEAVLSKPIKEPSVLVDIMFEDGSVAKTIQDIRNFNKAALQSLDRIQIGGLKHLPSEYTSWALSELVAPRYHQKAKEMLG